jgi:hypothetical protein
MYCAVQHSQYGAVQHSQYGAVQHSQYGAVQHSQYGAVQQWCGATMVRCNITTMAIWLLCGATY